MSHRAGFVLSPPYLPDPSHSAIWGLAGKCRAALGPPASPDSRPMSKRPRLEDGIVPGHRPFVRGHYKVSLVGRGQSAGRGQFEVSLVGRGQYEVNRAAGGVIFGLMRWE